jgi:hypothetical protein
MERQSQDRRLGFEEPIPMEPVHGGVHEMIRVFEQYAAQARQCQMEDSCSAEALPHFTVSTTALPFAR